MDFQAKMVSFKKEIDRELGKIFDVYIKEARAKDAIVAEALGYVKEIALAGGKRLRPALFYNTYIGFGGKEKAKALKVAAAIELVHLFLLVHDDIIDNGGTRHGKTTLHKKYAEKAKRFFGGAANEEYGKSMAIIIGDLIYVMAIDMVATSGFRAADVAKVVSALQAIVANTIIGQSQDIVISYKKNFSEKEVLAMYENKTARYTFEGPLHLGMILAGNETAKTRVALTRFALPLGIAFQVQDDIAGVFGSEKKTGKSNVSDIAEGKRTLLVVEAKRSASKVQAKMINGILGNKNITRKDVEDFKKILKDAGALAYTTAVAAKHIAQGKKELQKIDMKKESKEFLAGMIQYLETREL